MAVIKVQNISKRYRIGLKENLSNTLFEQLFQTILSPWENLKRLRQLSRFGEEDESVFWALKDVTFEVKEGEILGIIGKNGAGKSTLLKILSGITDPTSGRIELHGRVASLLEVGTGFHPELSGRDNIYMNGTILGMTRQEIDSKLDEIIDFSGVEKFIDTPVKFYSSGMKVRLGFSVAAHLEPEILIIDEVLAVGDYEFQKKCLGKMEDVAEQGRTVLFVSHNMGAINSLCSRGIILSHGCVYLDSNISHAIPSYIASQNCAADKSKIIQGDKGRGENFKIDFGVHERNIKIFCGDILSFEFIFLSPEYEDDLGVSFIVKKMDETIIFGSASNIQGVVARGSSRIWYVNADLGRIPINEGEYIIDLYIVSRDTQIAKFSNAIFLEVVSSDVFVPGKIIPDSRYWGNFFWNTKWEIKQ